MTGLNYQKLKINLRERSKTKYKPIKHHKKFYCKVCKKEIRWVKFMNEWIAFNLNGDKHQAH